MENVMKEGSSYNTLGEDLMNKLRYRAGGTFPTEASRADIVWALGELNKDTSDYMVRVAAKALERAGVRTGGLGEAVDRTDDVDFLINSAERDVPMEQALQHLREKGNGNDKKKNGDDEEEEDDETKAKKDDKKAKEESATA
jgi:hypothetical protein